MPTNNTQEPFDQRWLVLDHLLKDLNKNYDIPKEAIENLQMAKSVINYYKEDPTDPLRSKEVGRIDSYLNGSEEILLNIAEDCGTEYIKKWTQKMIDAAQGKEVYEYKPLKSKFIPGMPANFDFVRFSFQKPMPEERFYEICEYENVIIEFDDDQTIFVFGEKDNIQSSLQEMASFFTEQMDE